MTAFALAHPWMVCWLIVLALLVIDNAVVNWSKARAAKHQSDPTRGDDTP